MLLIEILVLNPKCYLTSVAEDFEFVSEVNHPQVKSLVDFYHEQIAEGNLIEKLEKNISKVGLVHIADVPGRDEPGTGETNYPNIYEKLADLNYTQYVATEFLPIGDPVATLGAARETAIRAVQRVGANGHHTGLRLRIMDDSQVAESRSAETMQESDLI